MSIKLNRFITLSAIFCSLSIIAQANATSQLNNTASIDQSSSIGSVYILTNDQENNEVVSFDRFADGTLSFRSAIQTGGAGGNAGSSVDALGSQGSLILSDNNKWLFSVNAGSDTFSVFRNENNELNRVQIVNSGGNFPVSLTLNNDILYVLNSGGEGNIQGFVFDDDTGIVSPIEDASLSLGAGGTNPPFFGNSPSQIAFSPNGNWLAVTIKSLRRITMIPVARDGTLGQPVFNASAGREPFGFEFTRNNDLVVAEVFSANSSFGGVSSYSIGTDGTLEVITSSLTTGQSFTCWIALDPRDNTVYATNNGSSVTSASVTSLTYSEDGQLTLNGSQETGSAPVDLAVTDSGDFIYVLNAGGSNVSAFRVPERSELENFASTTTNGATLFNEWSVAQGNGGELVFDGSRGLNSNPLEFIGSFGQGQVPNSFAVGMAVE